MAVRGPKKNLSVSVLVWALSRIILNSMSWKPNGRLSFFSPPAHIRCKCTVTQMIQISSTLTYICKPNRISICVGKATKIRFINMNSGSGFKRCFRFRLTALDYEFEFRCVIEDVLSLGKVPKKDSFCCRSQDV